MVLPRFIEPWDGILKCHPLVFCVVNILCLLFHPHCLARHMKKWLTSAILRYVVCSQWFLGALRSRVRVCCHQLREQTRV